MQLSDYLKLEKSILISIIYCHNRQPEQQPQCTKRPGQTFKLDNWAKKVLICHVEQNFSDKLKALDMLLKSG